MTQKCGVVCSICSALSDQLTEDVARLPLSMNGLGLRSAVRTSHAAHWASWADSVPMILKRHPDVARLIVAQLTDQVDSSHLSPILSRERLLDVSFDVPTWGQIVDGLPNPPVEDGEPGVPHHGWQYFATSGGRLLLPTRCRASFDGHPTGYGEVPVRSVGWPIPFFFSKKKRRRDYGTLGRSSCRAPTLAQIMR